MSNFKCEANTKFNEHRRATEKTWGGGGPNDLAEKYVQIMNMLPVVSWRIERTRVVSTSRRVSQNNHHLDHLPVKEFQWKHETEGKSGCGRAKEEQEEQL